MPFLPVPRTGAAKTLPDSFDDPTVIDQLAGKDIGSGAVGSGPGFTLGPGFGGYDPTAPAQPIGKQPGAISVITGPGMAGSLLDAAALTLPVPDLKGLGAPPVSPTDATMPPIVDPASGGGAGGGGGLPPEDIPLPPEEFGAVTVPKKTPWLLFGALAIGGYLIATRKGRRKKAD